MKLDQEHPAPELNVCFRAGWENERLRMNENVGDRKIETRKVILEEDKFTDI